MTDRLDPAVRTALRAEAYLIPVSLTVDDLRGRLEIDRRQRGRWRWLGAFAAATAIVLATAISWIPSVRPPLSGQTASAGACDESPATRHGSWWVEVGGPNAFFNIEPGTRTTTIDGTWLLFVRFDPDAGQDESVSIAATRLGSSNHVEGSLNSPADPSNIFKFDTPAPSLPGGWYLFELDIEAPGCWELSARTDDRVVGAATVQVHQGSPPASDRPGSFDPPTPAQASPEGPLRASRTAGSP